MIIMTGLTGLMALMRDAPTGRPEGVGDSGGQASDKATARPGAGAAGAAKLYDVQSGRRH